MNRDGTLQHARDPSAGKAGRGFQRRALPREAVDHAQYTEPLPGRRHTAGPTPD